MTRLRYFGQVGAIALLGVACGSTQKDPAGSGGALASTGGSGNTATGGAGGNGGAGGVDPYRDVGLVPFDQATEITEACTGRVWEPETRPVILEMVIDVSTSMLDQPPNAASGDSRNKWEMTRDALIKSLDRLPAAAWLGLTFYPNKTTPIHVTGDPNDECMDGSADLPIKELGNKLSQTRTDIVNRLNAITIPENAGTPTHDAYQRGLAAVGDLLSQPPDPKLATAPKYVLLITDGQPTFALGCMGYGVAERPVDPEPIITEIGNAYTSSQIETFVIGSPGSEGLLLIDGGTDARPWLSRAAAAGNTASYQPGCSDAAEPYCHFDMTKAADFGSALGKTLQDIAGAIAPCDYAVTPPDEGLSIDPGLVNVVYTDGTTTQEYAVVARQTSDCVLGWRYTDSTGRTIQICGTTCEYIGNDPFARMEILFGCKSVVTVL